MTLDLTIILPTLNERDNLAPLVERIENALGGEGWEVLVVDDNSSDGTAASASSSGSAGGGFRARPSRGFALPRRPLLR